VAKPIEMPFGLWRLIHVYPRNYNSLHVGAWGQNRTNPPRGVTIRRFGLLPSYFGHLVFLTPVFTRARDKTAEGFLRCLFHGSFIPGYAYCRGIITAKSFSFPMSTPRHHKRGMAIDIFKPNSHNIETHMSSKLHCRLQTKFCTTIKTTN